MNADLPSALAESLLDGVVPLLEPPRLVCRTSGRSGVAAYFAEYWGVA